MVHKDYTKKSVIDVVMSIECNNVPSACPLYEEQRDCRECIKHMLEYKRNIKVLAINWR